MTARSSRRSRTSTGPAQRASGVNGAAGSNARSLLGVTHTDIQKHLSPGTERRQSLQGFDPEYVDIVNYIVSCTHRIWEEGGTGLIYNHYLHNAKVHTGDGWFLGRDQVVANSIQSLSAFPDERAYAEAVVWTGNDQDGFYTSHLIFGIQHNTGHSVYGPPTGKKILGMGIALCFVKENLICEEWLVHDDLGAIRQLGLDVNETVARMARRDAIRPLQNYGDLERTVGQLTPEPYPPKTTTGFDVDDFVRRNLHEIWNRRMFNIIRDVYSENYLLHRTHGSDDYGRGDYVAFMLSLLAAFPDGRFSIDQLFWNGDEQTGYRTSMRWSLVGTHEGDGIYGEPTGVRFRLWGLTQHVIKDGKFVEEWTLFNEFALLKRLHLARLENAQR
ncbi:MAG: ester cyclase [Anaerolineales bacterium]